MASQKFVVDYQPCLIFHIKVVRGRNIVKGWLDDAVDSPDPYVELFLPDSQDGRRRTATIGNERNPIWNQTFRYLLDPQKDNVLSITLKEDNILLDQALGQHKLRLQDFRMNKWLKKTIHFEKGCTVDIEFKKDIDRNPAIRFGLDLCEKETLFLKARRWKGFDGMKRLLGDKGPKTIKEVPTVAVIGSGGGFRAMVAFTGVFKALKDTGLLDCTTYMAGVSGSAWFLSTLYSHPNWPGISPMEFQQELKRTMESDLFNLHNVFEFIKAIIEKWKRGQPISLTDFFGLVIGETLLKGRLDSKLSDQQSKLSGSKIPMPIYACVHVKKGVSAQEFNEWVEFTPYEIGMSKFGAFIEPKYFGSKFFMGQVSKPFDEPPLHYLQGIWGSAFSILLERLFDEKKKPSADTDEDRQALGKKLEEEEAVKDDVSGDEAEVDDIDAPVNLKPNAEGLKPPEEAGSGWGFWPRWISEYIDRKIFSFLSTRAGRAGVIHNYLRGISVCRRRGGHVDIDANDSDDSTDGFAAYSTQVKTNILVDAGLAFNSPFPLVLRRARGVDVILSFDFTERTADNATPLQELLLAEKWAKENGFPFPPIDTTILQKEGMKEMYIFRHPTDSNCPIILHFPLVNMDFQKYKKPGVLRETDEEKGFGDFVIFTDLQNTYSTFKFKYSDQDFGRLSQLTEFNTLNHLPEIRDVITERVRGKRGK